jgi:hypothetical protein
MTARLTTVISVSIAVICAVAPAAATAGFSSELVPVTAAVPPGNTQVSDVAMAPNGDALVAWSQGDATAVDAKVRRIHPDGTLGPILNVSDGSQPRSFTPKLAVTADGRTLVAWVQNISSGSPSGVRARWIEADDTLGAPITVRNGGVNSDSGELAAAPMTNGTVMLAFHNFSSTMGPFRRVEARRVDAAGNVGAILAPTSGAGSLSVQVEAASGGAALLSWREGGQLAQPISAADGIGGLQGPFASSASSVTSADGNDHFHLLYREGSPGSLRYRPLGPSGASGAEQTIDANSPSAGYALATNAANQSVAMWTKTSSPGQQDVNARIIGADGVPAATTSTTTVTTEVQGSVVGGITADGHVPLAWSQTTGGVTFLAGRVLSPGGDTAPTTLSGPGSASSPRATVAGSGLGVLAWSERLDPTDPNSNSRILLRQVLPPPTCADATRRVIQGRPTRLDLACSGIQLEAPAIVSPPEHGSVAAPAADQSVIYTPDPGFDGTDSFTFTAVNRGGPGAVQRATIDVGADTVRPKIKRFKLTKKGKRKFKLRYSEPATAKILIERRACAGQSKRCRKFKRIGKLRARKLAEQAKVPLKARIGGHRLGAGSYRATALATDAAKNRSKPKRLRFTVSG